MAIIQTLLAQLSILWRDPEANLSRLKSLCPLEPTEDLLILPEMFLTGFTDELEELTEAPGGPFESALRSTLSERKLAAVAGIARRHAEGEIVNEAIFMSPGSTVPVSYRKIRPFRSEHKVVTPGHTVMTFDHAGARFCPLICYDLRFPELFREGLKQGAEVYIVIASWPATRQHHWELLLQARAVENQAYVIGVNRCGDDPNFHYAGGSMVVDPLGEVVYHAGESESISRVALDIQRVRDWRAEFPATKDYLNEQ